MCSILYGRRRTTDLRINIELVFQSDRRQQNANNVRERDERFSLACGSVEKCLHISWEGGQ